jgi:acetyl/propionyl-CoA carboxylase alpha subunit
VKYFVAVAGRTVEVTIGPEGLAVAGQALGGGARLDEVEGTPISLVTIGGVVHRIVVRREQGRGRYTLWIDGQRHEVEALDERTHAIRQLSSVGAAPTGPTPLKAPMPGLIVRVAVQRGDQVQAGQGIVAIEAMKMENELRAPAAGTVKAVHVAPGKAVEKGALLVEFE